jgi:uracil phosphoribosyltransferase
LHEATAGLPTKQKRVRTPLGPAPTIVPTREILLVPILRAGQGLITLADQILPEARIGYLGIARNETTLQPEWYLEKLPPHLGRFEVFVVDPMLATAGSAIAAGKLLQKRGAKNLRFIHALAAPEGLRALLRNFSEAPIYTAALDSHLNENGYIVPGLGDAGDRCFGC